MRSDTLQVHALSAAWAARGGKPASEAGLEKGPGTPGVATQRGVGAGPVERRSCSA